MMWRGPPSLNGGVPGGQEMYPCAAGDDGESRVRARRRGLPPDEGHREPPPARMTRRAADAAEMEGARARRARKGARGGGGEIGRSRRREAGARGARCGPHPPARCQSGASAAAGAGVSSAALGRAADFGRRQEARCRPWTCRTTRALGDGVRRSRRSCARRAQSLEVGSAHGAQRARARRARGARRLPPVDLQEHGARAMARARSGRRSSARARAARLEVPSGRASTRRRPAAPRSRSPCSPPSTGPLSARSVSVSRRRRTRRSEGLGTMRARAARRRPRP